MFGRPSSYFGTCKDQPKNYDMQECAGFRLCLLYRKLDSVLGSAWLMDTRYDCRMRRNFPTVAVSADGGILALSSATGSPQWWSERGDSIRRSSSYCVVESLPWLNQLTHLELARVLESHTTCLWICLRVGFATIETNQPTDYSVGKPIKTTKVGGMNRVGLGMQPGAVVHGNQGSSQAYSAALMDVYVALYVLWVRGVSRCDESDELHRLVLVIYYQSSEDKFDDLVLVTAPECIGMVVTQNRSYRQV